MVVFLCGGCDCMWWWLYVVVEAVHGGDGHLCVAYIYIYTDAPAVLLVHVELAQARPNNHVTCICCY